MDDDIEAELDRALDPWRRKRVVRDRKNLAFARDFGDRFEIDDFQKRIARRLDPNHPRVAFDRLFETRCVREIDISKLKPRRLFPNFVEQTERPAVKIIADDNMRIALEQFENCRHRSEAGRKSKAARATFQIGYAFFVSEPRGIDRASVIEALVLARAFLDIG